MPRSRSAVTHSVHGSLLLYYTMLGCKPVAIFLPTLTSYYGWLLSPLRAQKCRCKYAKQKLQCSKNFLEKHSFG